MNLAQQRRMIAISAMVVFALGFLSHAQKGQLPTARFLVGTGGIFTIVSIFADLGLAIGAGMSVIVMLTAILTEGQPAIELLNTRAKIRGPLKDSKLAEEVAPGVTQLVTPLPTRIPNRTPAHPLGITPKEIGIPLRSKR